MTYVSNSAIYVVYYGEWPQVVGTADECAEFMGVSPSTVAWWSSPTNMERQERRGGVYSVRVALEDWEIAETMTA